MQQSRTAHDPLRSTIVSRRALLLSTAPAALLLGPLGTAASGGAPGPAPSAAPAATCGCRTPLGPMRVVGWAAYRLA